MPSLRAKELIKEQPPVTITPDTSLIEAAKKMTAYNIGSLPVVDEQGHLIGIITERDLVRVIAEHGPQALQDPVEKHMTRNPVTAHPEDPIPALAHKMLEHGIRHIPVVDEQGRLQGVVSIRRILRHIMAENEWP